MKPAIALVIGFVAAAAGSAGVKVMRYHPAVDSTAHDSTGTGDSTHVAANPDTIAGVAAHGDSAGAAIAAHGASTAADSAHAPARTDTTRPTAAPTNGTAAHGPATPTTPAPVASKPPLDSAAIEPVRRLAKVFTLMSPKEAGQLLNQFSESDAQILLDYLPPKQAAAILATLTPERAAALTKAAFRGGIRPSGVKPK